MRLPVLILCSIVLIISCKSTNKTKTSNDSETAGQQASAHPSAIDRHLLIEELKMLKTAFASRDKYRIADIFPFPVSDSILPLIPFDSSYMKELNKGEKITREMFIKYFDESYKYMQMEEINELFKYLDVDKLNHTDTLKHDVKQSKEPCMKWYEIDVSGNTVTLICGSNGNPSYIDPNKKSEDDETIGDECEFTSSWVFEFDGKKLRFKYEASAG